MKCNTLADVLSALETESPEIHVSPDIASKAFNSINKMLKISG